MMQKILTHLTHSRHVNFSVNVLLAVVWGVFVASHLRFFAHSGDHAIFLFALSETLQVIFFLTRQSPETVSLDPFDWFIAGSGTFAPLFLRPGGEVLLGQGELLVGIAVVFQILALLSLNRSFAIVAAKRTVKTLGLYRWVRHPMYASYIFLYGGYLLFNASPMNIFLVVMAMSFLFLRLVREEKHLLQDAAYQAYAVRTPWRLIPRIY
jgi:protein-S-isoprenylcysteine O-methyltransferase Ste14